MTCKIKDIELKCNSCQYCGDKYSFPIPNNKQTGCYYCCCGDSEKYGEVVSDVTECNCYEEL